MDRTRPRVLDVCCHMERTRPACLIVRCHMDRTRDACLIVRCHMDRTRPACSIPALFRCLRCVLLPFRQLCFEFERRLVSIIAF